MNRLVNALAFAAVVVAAFVMDSNLPQKLASSPTVARIVASVRGNELPAVIPPGEPPMVAEVEVLPPQIDQARLDRVMARAQAAQARTVRVDMRRVETRLRMVQARIAKVSTTCKVVKLEQ